MSNFPPPPEQWLTEQERAAFFETVEISLAELGIITQDLARKMIGDKVYDAAEAYEHLWAEEALHPPEELAAELADLDRETEVARIHDLLAMVPGSEDEVDRKLLLEVWIREVFPNETVLSILGQPEKLFRLATMLKVIEKQEAIAANSAVEAQLEAHHHINRVITAAYKKLKTEGRDNIAEIWTDEHTFQLSFNGNPPSDVTVSLVSGGLTLDRLPVVTVSQQREIEKLLRPLPDIVRLIKMIEDAIVQDFRD